jgi:arginine decarboxylase
MAAWDKVELMRLLKTQVDEAIKTDRLKPNDAMRLLSNYEGLFQEYTYLSLNGSKPVVTAQLSRRIRRETR